MTRVVPGTRSRVQSALGVVGAALITLGAAGCPGNINPDLIPDVDTTPCDPTPIFMAKGCATAGVCHDSTGFGANFDMMTAGWETHLVGVNPKGGGSSPSLCADKGPYLVAGTTGPAQGLFIKKLTASPGCGAQMPQIPTVPRLTTTEMSCVQRWANALVVAGPSGGGDPDGGGQ